MDPDRPVAEATVVAPVPARVKGTRITKLVLEGFKSFAKRTELLFGDRFNIVLGPNGSGKSNIADAICFVLGKSSARHLRAEKSAHLIYNGGKTKQPAKTAEVSIFFENKDKTFPLEETEVKVTRIVRADGASKYRINNKTVTRQEIIELLGTAKIDPDGYNIIMQGDIIRLVEMNPNDRRMIIEEIAGIGVYEEKKQKAIAELAKVDQRLSEADIILKERQAHLKDLAKEREAALKFKDMADKVKRYKATLAHLQYELKEQERSKIQERRTKIKEKTDQLQQKIQDQDVALEKGNEALKKLSQEINRVGEESTQSLVREIESLKVQIATNKQRLQSMHDVLRNADKQRQELTEKMRQAKSKASDLEAEQKEQTAIKEDYVQKLDQTKQRLNTYKKEKGLESVHALDARIEQIDKEIESAQQEIHQLRETEQQLVRYKDRAQFELGTIEKQEAKQLELQKQHQDEIKNLKDGKTRFKRLTIELNEILNKDSTHAANLGKVKKELQSLREDVAELQVQQARNDANTTDQLAKKIMENCQGVIGTVAQLGEVREKYELALEIAAGSRLNSIVVEDEKAASSCIQFLRERKLGVATFLPLDKVKAVAPEDIPKHPGIIDKAIHLVTFDPRYKNIFSHVFGNTIVVTDLVSARKIGIGSARIVTLLGDLIEKSGSMTGGFRRRRGAFHDRDISKSIITAQEKILNLEQQETQLTHDRQTYEERIVSLRTEKATLEGELIRLEKSFHFEDTEGGEDYKEALSKKIQKLDTSLQQAKDTLDEKTNKLTQIMTERASLREQTKQVRNPSVLAELHAYEQQMQQYQEQIASLSAALQTRDVKIHDIAGREIQEAEAGIEKIDREKTEAKKSQETVREQIEKAQAQLEKKEQEQATANAKFKELFAERDKLGNQIHIHEREKLLAEEATRREEITDNAMSIEESRISAEMTTLNEEISKYPGMELAENTSQETLKRGITEGERNLAQLGNVNLRSLDIFDAAQEEFDKLTRKREILSKEKDDVITLMREIENSKTSLFMQTLESVNTHFKRIFSELNPNGRTAQLKLIKPDQPFEDGLSIKVEVNPGKYLDIRSLSGGEKTMTALSFLFSIQEHEPASFYVMDEVDAALDKTNSEKLAHLVATYSKQAQYLIISHNDALINQADILYGVSMNPDAGRSNVVSMKT